MDVNNISSSSSTGSLEEDEDLDIVISKPSIDEMLSKIDETSLLNLDRPSQRKKYAHEDNSTPSWFKHKKHFFIFSYSGKPIYSRYGDEVALNTFIATLSAMSSFVESQNDELHHLQAGAFRFTFLHREPLVLSNVKAVFDAKYDLRDLLGGTDKFLDNLIRTIDNDTSILLNSVNCLRLNINTRNEITTIIQNNKHESVLESEAWTPICLPNFNDAGFLHLYICYIFPDVCLLLFSAEAEAFYHLSSCKNAIVKELESRNLNEEITKAVQNHGYTVASTEVPHLLHFMYKSRASHFTTSPNLTAPYIQPKEKKRLFRLYQHITNRVNNSCTKPHKYFYHTSQHETVIVAVASSHEIYATFSPLETKQNVFESFSLLLQWIKDNDSNLFIQS
eukprot:gene172-205_t